MPAELRVVLLGPPAIFLRGEPFTLNRRGQRALLFFLACQRGPVSRSELATLFWGNQPESPRGWAMEARVCAEDANANFVPVPGRINHLRTPGGPYVRTDTGIFQDEIATIVPDDGKPVYEKYCMTCHGAKGQGDGPGAKNLPGGPPAPFAKNMSLPYIFGVTHSGISHTMMYGFEPVLTETEIWDVTAYTLELTGGKFGG